MTDDRVDAGPNPPAEPTTGYADPGATTRMPPAAEGPPIPRGTTVALGVSKGVSPTAMGYVTVPDVTGMKEAKALYRADRSKKDAFIRQPGFHDPEAEAKALAKIRAVVTAQKRFRPFFYSTDETGVANLVEAWDFCFSPLTLSAMRKWLLDQYGSLVEINREWGTNFATLEDVTPFSTDEMMKRGGPHNKDSQIYMYQKMDNFSYKPTLGAVVSSAEFIRWDGPS